MATAIEAMVKLHREWLENNGAKTLGRESEYLQQDIEEGTPAAFQQIPDSLYGLATHYGILGIVELIDGQMSGWNHVSMAIDFRGWELKICAELYRRVGSAPNLTNQVSPAACLACVSEKWGGMAKSILREIDRDQESVDQAYWKSRRFEPFVAECCSIRDGREPSNDNLEPPYDAVVQKWNDDSALVHALEQVCEYHCANMDDVGGDWDPEFKHSPFDLLPCEVMLVRRIRRELGLSIPEVPHPLVTLLSPPDVISSAGEDHELIAKLSRAYDQCFA
ncbi:hypothetical protein [Blastopirellula marina]|uniref:Uncharacterized protein n=1 Tax=Blastopirellula marina TaxID=124 RepID=A0A2S8FWA2_9BACT|nr:hypothetical protein [Blastopirellula marina]PQO36457.1 hypothetical protein C5Y98_12200 [Blastopirellula marina]PTL44294.1 hypothetical protein C5Y97_12210 [Blastopirellula marina]